MTTTHSSSHQEVISAVSTWLERAVIGLNLCPFAKAVHHRGQVRYVVSEATEPEQLVRDLTEALQHLHDCDPAVTDTTLLIHPWILQDFIEYNEFLGIAELILSSMGLEGEIQIASFHPDYQFADTHRDDITNFTNRSPYPILHLLREDSIASAVAAYPDTDDIYRRNIATLEKLGLSGWEALFNEAEQERKE
ncbi:DUF1415 domain-containing protein [Noviherbaspirillum soli]|uniref:DUF1415 domain-containing protein n=1 Tax=Noviherbaspirillum soli TaxID=1064518 RepID=UPI00188C7AE0|nr:DUF1415 domain-containing protein [Noviherbaspirillum soli]